MAKKIMKKYQVGGQTAADKVATQRAINEQRKAEAQARTAKAKTDARAKIDQAQKNTPVTPFVEELSRTGRVTTGSSGYDYNKPQVAAIPASGKEILRDKERTRRDGNRVVIQKTKENGTINRTKKVYDPGKETVTTKTTSYDPGNRRNTVERSTSTVSTKPAPKPAPADYTRPMNNAYPIIENVPIEKKGGTITALDQVDRMEKAKLLRNKK